MVCAEETRDVGRKLSLQGAFVGQPAVFMKGTVRVCVLVKLSKLKSAESIGDKQKKKKGKFQVAQIASVNGSFLLVALKMEIVEASKQQYSTIHPSRAVHESCVCLSVGSAVAPARQEIVVVVATRNPVRY